MQAIASPFQRQMRIRHISIFQLALLLIASCLSIVLSISTTFAHAPSSPPVPRSQIQNVTPFRWVCHYAGVSKDSNGTYHFSWLHVDSSTGYIMDEHNCIVDLRGFNSAGTEFADGVSPFTGLTPQRLTWFNSMFKMNYIRLNLNIGWWNSDVYVPNAQMHYQAWIQKWITWAEQNGDYVILNRTNEYQVPPSFTGRFFGKGACWSPTDVILSVAKDLSSPTEILRYAQDDSLTGSFPKNLPVKGSPPCGDTITYCPGQVEASDIDDNHPQQQYNAGHLLDQTLTFWKSIVPLYKSDPAILYNDWNELHDINATTWLRVQTTLITTIRSINSRSLIMLGGYDWNNTLNPLTNGQVADLSYPNLVYDWHIYDGKSGPGCVEPNSYMWAHWGAESTRQFTFAHQHGHGAIINEWGGCLDDPTYNTALSSYAVRNHIGMAYYMPGNVVNGAWTAISVNGILAQAAYARFSN